MYPPVPFIVESSPSCNHGWTMQTMERYRRQALRLAEVSFLGKAEGYAARIPGFRGLIATGHTKRESLVELESALVDWIDLALKRGLGLPPVNTRQSAELVSAH